MGAQWLPWQPRGPLAANPQRRSCHKSTDTFWLIRPDVSYNWLQWPHLTPSSGRFFQKVTDRWADHTNQLLVRTGSLKCLAKPNPAAIPSNDLLLSKNPAKEPILVNVLTRLSRTKANSRSEQRPLWPAFTNGIWLAYLWRQSLLKWSNLTWPPVGPATSRRGKTVNDWTRGQLGSRTSLFQVATHT